MKYLFIPGMLCDKRLWAAQISHLKKHKIITNNNLLIADVTQDNNIISMAQRALDSTEDDLNIIAFSLGTQVAFEIIKLAPTRVKRLALFAAACGGLTAPMRAGLAEALSAAEKNFDAYLIGFFERYLAPGGVHYEVTRQTFMAMAKDLGQAVCLRQLNALLTSEITQQDAKSITCPTLIVDGDKDRRLPPWVQHKLHESIPHSTLKMIDDVEHFSMLQSPDAVNNILVQWLG